MLEVPCDKQLVVLILQPGAIKPLQEAGAKWAPNSGKQYRKDDGNMTFYVKFHVLI